MAAINNKGIGGVNAHLIIEPNYKIEDLNNYIIAEQIPRIVNICARNEEAISYYFDFVQNNPKKVTKDFLALLTNTMKVKPSINSSGFPYRGIFINNESLYIEYLFI